MEEDLQQLEATHGVPASLLERSAAARARASGSTTDAVLQAWLGGDAVAVPADAAAGAAPADEGVGGDSDQGAGAAASPAAIELTGPALLAAVAEARGMPESLVERSAKARAGATGGSVEAVLLQWAEEEGLAVPADAAAGAAPADEGVGGDSDEGAGAAASPAAIELTGPALLAAVAEARGTPEALIERSAKARANAIGESVETVLLQWAEEERLAAPSGVPPALRRGDAEDRSDVASSPASSSPPSATMLSGSALLTAVAEARGMPESLIERSATARAKTAGVELDDVLREWAEEEGLDVGTAADAPATEEGGHAEEGGADAGVTPAAVVSGGSLLAAVAAARNMPESLVERSAKARAKQQGGTVDEVLAEWAAEEGLDVGVVASGSPEPSAAASADAGVTPAAVVSGGSLLAAVAAARNMPESLVERSAKARAKQQGGTVDEVLAEWAAEEGLDATATGSMPSDDSPDDVAEVTGAAASVVPAKAEIPSPPSEVAAEAPAPEPEEPPSPRSRYPAWLAAVLVVIPLLAVLYVVAVPNQPSCGSAGQLAVDPATGEAVGCDGGAYGADEVSNFGVGAEIYASACAACHGANGGGGAGPAMAGGAVLDAFPVDACSSQVEWITLGSSNWPDATYGANDTPVAGGMPGFEGQLTETEIAQVTLYERVEFGGLEVEPAEADCGFEAADGDS